MYVHMSSIYVCAGMPSIVVRTAKGVNPPQNFGGGVQHPLSYDLHPPTWLYSEGRFAGVNQYAPLDTTWGQPQSGFQYGQ